MPTWGGILVELQQLVNSNTLAPGASPFDVVRRRYLQLLAKHTGRCTILYASKWTQSSPGPPDVISIVPEDIQGFMEVIHGLPSGNGLDLLLHSPGGSGEVTEALVKYLRSKFDDVRVIIPNAAMSAACMLACSANRIMMGKHSFIGPIDPQLIVNIPQFGQMSVAAHAILEQFALAKKECADPALLPSWMPMLSQYGPALIVQCKLALDLSQSLVSDWLALYMFAGAADADSRAAAIASALSDHGTFKSHSRFIARDHAKSLGLVIDDMEADQALQDRILSVFHATTHTFSATAAVKLIENDRGKSFIKHQQQLVVNFAQPGGPGAPPSAPP